MKKVENNFKKRYRMNYKSYCKNINLMDQKIENFSIYHQNKYRTIILKSQLQEEECFNK